jgi:hypothetical protein
MDNSIFDAYLSGISFFISGKGSYPETFGVIAVLLFVETSMREISVGFEII